jgi:signal transduction histidine kinase
MDCDLRKEGAAMTKRSSQEWEDRKKRRKSRRGRKHRHFKDVGHDNEQFDSRRELEALDESLLSPEERAYRKARRAAEERAEIYLESGKAGAVVLVLLLILPFLGVPALIWWGFVHGRRLFKVMVEPGLRERLVEDEVTRHVHSSVGKERVELADEHSRSLEVLSASIAHEIRNPITAAKSLLQQISELPEAPDNPEYAQVALAELERVERSISHLLRFSREEELRMSRIRMADVLDSALETFRERAEREGIEIHREFDCDGVMRGDSEKLRRVVINLVGNGMDALTNAGISNPRLEISMGENLAGTVVWVRIRDNGLGIDPEKQAQLFTPFVTGKSNGTGLGLAITKKLVEAHAGSIEVSNGGDPGAEFLLSFPKDRSGGSDRDERGGRS